ncbi:MAG: GDP-L-fucose synthase, partial [Paracoccaceae bacterium]
DITIADLARLIAGITGFEGRITFDPTKPDGTPRKLLDVSRLTKMGWKYEIGLQDGLRDAYRWFLENRQRPRN